MALNAPTTRHLDTSKKDPFAENLRQVLASHSPRHIPDNGEGLKHAGVLIPMLLERETWKIVLTRRSRKVAHHKGQISFPGGGVDRQDHSYEETALRETFEEIGLSREEVEILGRIDDIQTVASRFVIHPFVGRVFPGNGFKVNAREVDGIIKIPIGVFLETDSFNERFSVTYQGKPYETLAYQYHEDLIWGATAGMIKNLVDIVGYKIGLLRGKK